MQKRKATLETVLRYAPPSGPVSAARVAMASTIALAACSPGGDALRGGAGGVSHSAARIDGVNLVAAPYPLDSASLAPATAAGAEWVAIVPYAFVPRTGGAPVYDRRGQFEGETLSGVGETVRLAQGQGLRVLIKPHLWVSGQGWAGDHLPGTAELESFEAGYADYVLAFARLADSLGVDMLSVGTEIDRHARARPEFWRKLIRRVRAEFGGDLTYAANWDAYAEIAFWDHLDFVGIDAYFPLVDSADPTLPQLRAAWQPWVEEIEQVVARVGRPVLFTEFGYRNVPGGAWRQWELPSGREADDRRSHDALQASAYEALFDVWWNRPWFAGGFLWKWFTPPAAGWSVADESGRVRRASNVRDSYTPQGKPAMEVVRRWYSGPAP